MEYIAVVLGGESSDSRNKDAQTLLDVGFANYSLCPLVMEEPLPELKVELGKKNSVSLEYGGDAYALVEGKGQTPEYELEFSGSVRAPVKQGDELGSLKVSLGGETVAEIPLCAGEDVERIGFFGLFKRLGASLFAL